MSSFGTHITNCVWNVTSRLCDKRRQSSWSLLSLYLYSLHISAAHSSNIRMRHFSYCRC